MCFHIRSFMRCFIIRKGDFFMIVDRFGAMILVVVKYMFNAFVTFIAFLRVQVPKKGRKENKL